MAFARKHLMGALLVSGLLTYGLGACTSDSSTGPSTTGGSGGSGSGGATSSGGSSTVSSSGGSQGGATSSTGGQAGSSSSSKGGDASGGKTTEVTSTGGTTAGGSSGTHVSSSGGGTTIGTVKGGAAGAGTTGTGGTTGGGSTGTVTGGKGGTGTGTSSAPGGAPGTGGTSSAGGGTGTPGECKKGGFKGSELVIFGESFYDWSPPYIKQRMEENARKAGSLGANDSYRQVAVAGQNMSYIANTEYDKAVSGGKFTKVVMDGGGIDCMSSSCPTCPDTLKGLFDKFAKQGVDQVIYTRYPEPGNPPGSNTSLKKNLDALMPNMQKVCEGATNLKCYWVDLRPVWKDGDTSDGLHPTKSGGDHVGDAIWAEMVKQCMAQ